MSDAAAQTRASRCRRGRPPPWSSCATAPPASRCSWWCATTRSTSPRARWCFRAARSMREDSRRGLGRARAARRHEPRARLRGRGRAARPSRRRAWCSPGAAARRALLDAEEAHRPGRDLPRAAARGRDDLPRSRARREPDARHRPDGALRALDHAGSRSPSASTRTSCWSRRPSRSSARTTAASRSRASGSRRGQALRDAEAGTRTLVFADADEPDQALPATPPSPRRWRPPARPRSSRSCRAPSASKVAGASCTSPPRPATASPRCWCARIFVPRANQKRNSRTRAKPVGRRRAGT